MTAIWSPDWRDEQAASNYPFADRCSLTAGDGLPIDPAMILDATVYTIGGQAGVYLSRADVAGGATTLWFGDTADPRRASGRFDPIRPPTTIALVDVHGRPAGLLVTDPGALALAQAWPRGGHDFDPDATELVASCVVPTPEVCLRGLLTADGVLTTGDVWLIGEAGVVLSWDGVAIRIDLVGDPLFARRVCWPLARFRTPSFLKAIDVIMPDGSRSRVTPVNGNIIITAGPGGVPDTILRIAIAGPQSLKFGVVGRSIAGK